MRLNSGIKLVLGVVFTIGFLFLCGIFALSLMFNRTAQFREQAKVGVPIVSAIEQFQKVNGSYPTSLVALVPGFLPQVPEVPNEASNKFSGWDYQILTNGTVVSYRLSYYMGRGGVEYLPPNWIGNNEGSRKFIKPAR